MKIKRKDRADWTAPREFVNDPCLSDGVPAKLGSATMQFPGCAPIQIELSELDMIVCPLEDYSSERITEKVVELLNELESRGYKDQLLANDLETFDFTPGPFHDLSETELLRIIGQVHDEADRRDIDLNDHQEYRHAGWTKGGQKVEITMLKPNPELFKLVTGEDYPNA